jgi:hypothetical protein
VVEEEPEEETGLSADLLLEEGEEQEEEFLSAP